jgi:hypothetical protein
MVYVECISCYLKVLKSLVTFHIETNEDFLLAVQPAWFKVSEPVPMQVAAPKSLSSSTLYIHAISNMAHYKSTVYLAADQSY